MDLIKERRRMVAKVAESDKRNQAIAQMLQKEKEDNQKSENSKLLQLEALMEKQLMDFDIEREQYKAKIRKEEAKVKELIQQLTDIKQTVLGLQRQSISSSRVTGQLASVTSAPSDASKGADGSSNNGQGHLSNSTVESGHTTSSLVVNPLSSSIPQSAKLVVGPSLVPPASVTTQSKEQSTRSTTEDSSKVEAVKLVKPVSGTNRPQSVIVAQKSTQPLSSASLRTTPGVNLIHASASSTISSAKTSSPASSIKPPQIQAVRSLHVSAITSPKPPPQPVALSTSNKISTTNPAEHAEAPSRLTDTSRLPSQSPRTNVPPHLGSYSDGKVTAKSSSGVLSQSQTSKDHPSTNRTGTGVPRQVSDKGSSVKQKPAPPVRNVSLSSTRKYKSIDNSKKLITSSTNSTP